MSNALRNEDGSFKYPLVEPSEHLFIVIRTSDRGFSENAKPCDRSQPVTVKYRIKIRSYTNEHVITLNSITELMDFTKEIDEECIIAVNSAGYNVIEIYDDYRE